MTCPTGSESGNRIFATLDPRRATLSARRTSRAVKFSPDCRVQFRIAM
jgi:hypothetical protein